MAVNFDIKLQTIWATIMLSIKGINNIQNLIKDIYINKA